MDLALQTGIMQTNSLPHFLWGKKGICIMPKKGQHLSEEAKAKISAAKNGRKPTLEHRLRQSEAQKAAYAAHPERRERQREILAKVRLTGEEFTAKVQEFWETHPEAREKQAESTRQANLLRWSRPRKQGKQWILSEETRRRQSIAFTGKPKSAEHRRHLSLAKLGKKNPKLSEARFGFKPSDETRQKMSASGRGRRKSHRHRRAISQAIAQRYTNPEIRTRQVEIALKAGKVHRSYPFTDARSRQWKFRSSWELDYAKALDVAGLLWTYETDRLSLSDGSIYIPDFYVSEWATYVEIKGLMREHAQAKIEA